MSTASLIGLAAAAPSPERSCHPERNEGPSHPFGPSPDS
jgi:hypothetical protein